MLRLTFLLWNRPRAKKKNKTGSREAGSLHERRERKQNDSDFRVTWPSLRTKGDRKK